jgi:hypothetical protein
MQLKRIFAVSLVLGALAVACLTPEPSLEERTYAPPGPALERVAVIPFYAHRSYEGSSRLGGVSAAVATERSTRHVAEALAANGIAVVPAEELAAVIADVPRSTAAIDVMVFAEIAGRELAATGVILGEVMRFREPRGASAAARRPASVAYQLTLYEVPDAYKLWTGRFDETQNIPPQRDEEDPLELPTSVDWKSADELAIRGADAVAKALLRVR